MCRLTFHWKALWLNLAFDFSHRLLPSFHCQNSPLWLPFILHLSQSSAVWFSLDSANTSHVPKVSKDIHLADSSRFFLQFIIFLSRPIPLLCLWTSMFSSFFHLIHSIDEVSHKTFDFIYWIFHFKFYFSLGLIQKFYLFLKFFYILNCLYFFSCLCFHGLCPSIYSSPFWVPHIYL